LDQYLNQLMYIFQSRTQQNNFKSIDRRSNKNLRQLELTQPPGIGTIGTGGVIGGDSGSGGGGDCGGRSIGIDIMSSGLSS
jgi:hypothetical protein